MKRILAMMLLLIMLFGMVACNGEGGDPTTGSTEDSFIGSVSGSVSGSFSESESLSLSAGVGASGSVSGSDSSSSSGDGTEPEPDSSSVNYLPVVVDGVMQYEIVYENSVLDTAVIPFIKELGRLGIKDKNGNVFDASDYTSFCTRDTRAKNQYSPDTKQIYIGNTVFEESQTAATDLRYRDYVVGQVGNKIVCVAGSAEVLKTAASTCLVLGVRKAQEGNFRAVMAKTYNANYVLGDVTICGTPLKDFTILYADGTISVTSLGTTTKHSYEEYAKEMQARLQNDYGYVLEVKKASTITEGANEILIGPTNRALSSAVATPKEQHYGMKTQGTQVALKCFGHSSYVYLDDAFVKYIARQADAEKNASIAAGVTHTALSGAIDYNDIPTADGTVRFMSFNVLSQLQGWKPAGEIAPTVAERKEAFLGLLSLVQADIIGFQEVTDGGSDSWATQLPNIVKNTEYSLILRDIGEKSSGSPLTSGRSGTSYNVIAYNKNKFKAVAYGVHCYSNSSSYSLRNVGWVLFEGLSGTAHAGQRFIFMNGHWDFADTTTGSRALQRKQGTELGEKINLLVQKYNCPVIAVADYNCPRDSETLDVDGQKMNQAITNLLTKGNMVDSRKLAEKHTGAISGSDAMPGGCVDHIFVRNGFGSDCLFFRVFAENGIGALSDHKPLVADIKLRS